MLRKNLQPVELDSNRATIEIFNVAVASGQAGQRTLVRARNRNDGTLNTWRHSLEEYSQYSDKFKSLPSSNQETQLSRSLVTIVPLFGDEGALKPGVTFVKLDCEGAEMEILLSAQSREEESWLDVTHLVFEWSFTKDRRVNVFHKAVDNLETAGFSLSYDGQGSWWDTQEDVMWPFHSDLVVFAVRKTDDETVKP